MGTTAEVLVFYIFVISDVNSVVLDRSAQWEKSRRLTGDHYVAVVGEHRGTGP